MFIFIILIRSEFISMKLFLFLTLYIVVTLKPVPSLAGVSQLGTSSSGGVTAGGVSLWDEATPMLWSKSSQVKSSQTPITISFQLL